MTNPVQSPTADLRHVLSIFELEMAIYALQYARDNHADWLPIRAAGIARLFEAG